MDIFNRQLFPYIKNETFFLENPYSKGFYFSFPHFPIYKSELMETIGIKSFMDETFPQKKRKEMAKG
jgi:hypothetical protein